MAMNSAKTLNLLAVLHNYRSQGKEVLLLKPKLDVRFGQASVRSRSGLEADADMLVDANTKLCLADFEGKSCVLVDESQFLPPQIVDQLRELTINLDIPVICYGLRADFRSELFAGSKRLFELSDSIEEIKTTCHFCNRKAIMNLKHVDGKATLAGPSIDLGADEKYFPACFQCYREQTRATS